MPWKNKGYDDKTIELLANLCFRNSVRTLDGMDNYIQKLFKLGLVSENSIYEYLNDIKAKDEKINLIFERIGISKKVRQSDRILYEIWTKEWQLSEDLILETTKKCIDKENAISYLNKILSTYHEKGIFNIELLRENEKLLKMDKQETTETPKSKLEIHSLSGEELVAMFENLDEVEI